jgi:hypothetical protein
MKPVFAQNYHIDPGGAPLEAVQSATNGMASSIRSRLEEMARQEREIAAIEEAHRYELRNLLGASGYDELAALRRREERLRGVGKQPESQAEIIARRTERKERVRALLGELKVSPDRIRALNRESRAKVAKTVPPPPTVDGHIATTTGAYDLPAEIRNGSISGWTVYRPPFPEWWWYHTGWTNGFGFAPEVLANQHVGMVGNVNALFDTNASDFDHAQIEFGTSVGFWYQMPRNGRLDIRIEAHSDAALHQLSLVDEWGASDAFSWQENYLAAKCDGLANDPWQKVLTSWMKYDGDSEGSWNLTYIPFGTIRWAQLVTQNWFPKDSWVQIKAGTINWHRATTNDMQIWSTLRFQWSIRSVWVDAIG